MSIKEIGTKCKGVGQTLVRTLERQDIFTVLLILLVGIASFGLGRLSALDTTRHGNIEVLEPLTTPTNAQNSPETRVMNASALSASVGSTTATQGKFVASKSGTKYHYPWCSGAKRIKDENKVWFDTAEAARAAGYTPAANCPGLE